MTSIDVVDDFLNPGWYLVYICFFIFFISIFFEFELVTFELQSEIGNKSCLGATSASLMLVAGISFQGQISSKYEVALQSYLIF